MEVQMHQGRAGETSRGQGAAAVQRRKASTCVLCFSLAERLVSARKAIDGFSGT